MKNENQIIELTPIEELFSEKELMDMFFKIKPKLHHCYDHSCLFAHFMQKKYPTIEYHEGLYSDYLILHAWNSIIKDGKRLYFDFTGYFLEKSRKIERYCDAHLLRTYSPKEIFKLMYIKGQGGCQMERDGSYEKFVNENYKNQVEYTNRLFSFEKILYENLKKHEIICPCVSC